jgi:hypothetical protein
MKTKIKELDVDFIGGQESMTKEEERAISEFIKARKLLIAKKNVKSTKATHSKKSHASL